MGLSQAPNFQLATNPWQPDELAIEQVGAVVVPAGALGGETVLQALQRQIPVIAVESNKSILQVSAAALGWGDTDHEIKNSVLHASSYSEAAGMVLALREGINPKSLHRPLAIASRP